MLSKALVEKTIFLNVAYVGYGIHAELTSLNFPQELMRLQLAGHYAAPPV